MGGDPWQSEKIPQQGEMGGKEQTAILFNKLCNNNSWLLERERKYVRKIENKYIFNSTCNFRYGYCRVLFLRDCTPVSHKRFRHLHPPAAHPAMEKRKSREKREKFRSKVQLGR